MRLCTGGLSLRVSSAADILERDGEWRSEKSQAPTQCESDFAAYGTLGGKLLGCKRQRAAWDANALLLAPIFAPISEPLPADRRARGEFGDASFARARILAAYEESGVDPGCEVQRATKDLRAAAASPLNRATRDV